MEPYSQECANIYGNATRAVELMPLLGGPAHGQWVIAPICCNTKITCGATKYVVNVVKPDNAITGIRLYYASTERVSGLLTVEDVLEAYSGRVPVKRDRRHG